MLHTPVPSGVPVHQPFSDHIPADRAEIIIEICNDDIDLPLGIDPVILEFLHDYVQNDPFFLALGGNRLQFAVLKNNVDHFLAVYGISLGLGIRLIRLLLNDIQDARFKDVLFERVPLFVGKLSN